jgi:hypothetical protein
MNTSEFSEQFIDKIATKPRLYLAHKDVGRLVTTFPVVGGGHGCIVLGVGDKFVRLIQQPELWVVEHIVVRGEDE